jgi:hypothetical protein
VRAEPFSKSPGAVSRPRSVMGQDFMRTAQASTEIRSQERIISLDFRWDKRNLFAELTGHSSGQMTGVI